MVRLQLVDPETAPPETQAAYEKIRRDWGGMLLEPAEERELGACLARAKPVEPRTR